MDLSIIVISYNHEKFISQTIRSLIGQKTNYSYEILIGDDCSKDGTLEIILKYQSLYPQIVKNVLRQVNLGATKNLYDLMRRAKGRYIAFCEGDDYWSDDNRIQKEIDFLDNHLEYSGVCGRTIPVDENGTEISIEKIEEKRRFWLFKGELFELKDFSEWKMPGHLSAITLRNCLLNKEHNYDIIKDAHSIVADRTIAMIATLNGSVKCSEYISSCYRFRININSSNYMSSMAKNNYRLDDFVMLRRLEEYALEEFGKELYLNKIKNERLIGATVTWMKNRNKTNWGILRGIIKNSGQKPIYLLYTLKIIILKMYYWNVLKEDRLINLGGSSYEVL